MTATNTSSCCFWNASWFFVSNAASAGPPCMLLKRPRTCWTALSITLLDQASQAFSAQPAFLHGNYRPCKATGRPFLDAADLQPPQTILNVVAFQPRESESQELAHTESILSCCTCSKDGIHLEDPPFDCIETSQFSRCWRAFLMSDGAHTTLCLGTMVICRALRSRRLGLRTKGGWGTTKRHDVEEYDVQTCSVQARPMS
jgi:hypothetical protein